MQQQEQQRYQVIPCSVGDAGLTERPAVWDVQTERVVEAHYYQGTPAGWAAANRRAAELNEAEQQDQQTETLKVASRAAQNMGLIYYPDGPFWTGQVPQGITLDEVFRMFNRVDETDTMPEDYHLPSLSVGDRVVFMDRLEDGICQAWEVERAGWRRVF